MSNKLEETDTRDMGNGSKREMTEERRDEARSRSTNQPAEDVTLCLLDSGEGQEERHDRSPQRYKEIRIRVDSVRSSLVSSGIKTVYENSLI